MYTVIKPWRRPRPIQGCSTSKGGRRDDDDDEQYNTSLLPRE
jgi:hypothetical protein